MVAITAGPKNRGLYSIPRKKLLGTLLLLRNLCLKSMWERGEGRSGRGMKFRLLLWHEVLLIALAKISEREWIIPPSIFNGQTLDY